MRGRANAQPTAPGSWVEEAACLGADLSYDAGRGKSEVLARDLIARYCDHCAVIDPCREWALTSPDPAADHVAGGLTVRERKHERKKQ